MGSTDVVETVGAEPAAMAETMHANPTVIEPALERIDIEEALPTRTKLRLAAILLALCLSLFIVALDQTITSTAVPTITRDLHSASGYFWIGSAYLLANAATCSVWARGSDIWGRKPVLLTAVALFFGSSIMAALSNSMRMLIVSRVLQGTAGGGISQLVMITVSDLFSLRLRALFIGVIEFVWTVAGGTGPLLGGALAQYVSWRWIFWINLPIAGTAFILLIFFLDVHNPRTRMQDGLGAIDWFGTASLLGVTLMLLLGLDFGGVTFPWHSATVICLIIFGAVMIGVFVFSEKKLARYPLMPLKIFNDWRNVAVTIVLVSQGMIYIAADFYLPLYLQAVKGASPFRSGVLVLPWEVLASFVGALTGVIIHKTGRYRELIWFATFTMTLGSGLFILLGPKTTIAQLVGFEVVTGAGAGPLFQAPIIAVQAVVAQADVATATSTFGFLRHISTSLSLVVGGVVIQNGMKDRAGFLKAAGLNETLLQMFSGNEAAANVEDISRIPDEFQREAVKEAFAWSLRNIWIMYTCIAAVGAIASLFIVQQHLSIEHTETRTGIEHMNEKRRREVGQEADVVLQDTI